MMIRAIVTLLFLLLSIKNASENRIKITGYVRDTDGNPLELVNVRIKNTLSGTITNEKGPYSLPTPTKSSVSSLYSCPGCNKAERIIPSASLLGGKTGQTHERNQK